MAEVYRNSPTYGAPGTLTNGHPPSNTFVPSSETIEPWGTVKVEVGPAGGSVTDVTNLRSVPMVPPEWVSRDPFGPFTATLRFPQVTGFDNVTTPSGDLAWLADGNEVTITLVRPDTTTKTLFTGLVESWAIEENGNDGALTVTCIGPLYQANDFVRAPGVDDGVYDIGDGIDSNLDPSAGVRPSLHTDALSIVGGPTGIDSNQRGSWERVMAFLEDLLAQTISLTGDDQWTLDLTFPWQPVLKVRDRTTVNWTLTYGTRGVTMNLIRDWSQCFNVIYGAGVDPGGDEWRNLHIFASGAVFWQPLSYDDLVHGLDEDGSGGLVDNTARTDDSLRRRELFINFGEGITFDRAKELAEGLRLRMADPGWVGTITLNGISPQEGALYEMVAGQNVKVKHYAGSSTTGILMHISECRVNLAAAQVTLTVDSKFRSFDHLDAVLERHRDPRNPARALRLGRGSTTLQDRSRAPWDAYNGAGYLPTTRAPRFNAGVEGTQTVSLTANTWHIERMVASDGPEAVGPSTIVLSANAEFAAAVFDWDIGSGSLPGNPLTTTTDWSVGLPGCLVAWGNQNEPAGYSPGKKSDGATKTGDLIDRGAWTVRHDRGTAAGSGDASNAGTPAFVWVAIFADTTCTAHGKFDHGVS